MQILNQLETQHIPIEEEEKRHTRRLLVGVLCALLLTGTVLGGSLYLRRRHERQVAADAEVEIEKKAPKVEVCVDEATANGKTTLLSGTLHNISNEPLHNLAVELQLRRRVGSGTEIRAVPTDPTELAPDGRTRYSRKLPVQDYISVTFLRVVGGDNRAQIAFKALPGVPRPPMDPPASKTVVVSRPAPKGEQFINTPNTPGRLP